jgi:hypothetical protein
MAKTARKITQVQILLEPKRVSTLLDVFKRHIRHR